VKPSPFGYSRPATTAEALALLAELGDEGKVLAGGQSLVPLMSMRLAVPEQLVDINGLTELGYVRVAASGEPVEVGALARHAQVLRDPAVAAAQPLLAKALRFVAHPAVRSRGTTVGSLVHADPAGEMTAVLAVLGGAVRAARESGERLIPASEFFLGPLESALAPGELAVQALFPPLPPHGGTAFAEVSRRHGDYALAGVAVTVLLGEDGRIQQARAAYLSAGPGPVVADLTEAVAGLPADAAAFGAAAALARSAVRPPSDVHATADYRRHLAGVLTERALREAAQEARDRAASRPPTTHPRAGPYPGPGHAAPTGRDIPAGTGRLAGGGVTPDGEPGVRAVRLTVNGAVRDVRVPPRRLLSDCLRHDLGLTGTHVGCEHGVCGACTVLVDGEPARSCLMLAVSADGAAITTVEGLAAPDGTLSPVQQAFADCHGLQCGFCTPGFLISVTAALRDNPRPTQAQAREMVGGNLCRCTGYANIVRSVLRAAELAPERRP
jgi:CO/xanthine dehydrogenase FAD-binding subunit/aerobic-type carbon monoxide dehydrogenase small subunit (CoxS/CutS family)